MSAVFLENSDITERTAHDFAHRIKAPAVIYLEGDLGAGKTTFVRGLLRGLGYQGSVKSPTFTVVETYQMIAMTLVHADLYRINHSSELEAIGFRDYFNDHSIVVIEWASRLQDWLPKPSFLCMLKIPSDGKGRWLEVVHHL